MRLRLLPQNSGLGLLPYAWLAFLGFFAVGLFAPPMTATKTALNIAGLVVFLVVFFRAFWIDDGPRLLTPIGVCILLGVALSFINPGSAVFFHYASFFSGRLGRWQHSLVAVVTILVVIIANWYLRGFSLQYLLTAGLVSAALGAISLQIYSFEKIQRRLARSETEVEQLATIAERERIARDLHDVVGHTLSVIALKSELAQRLFSDAPEKSQQEMADVEDIARNALDEVRKTITGYKHVGIQNEILNAHKSLRSADIKSHFEPTDASIAVTAEHESALIMVLKEAVTNVIRHSQAGHCQIALEASEGGVILTVHDDGVGYKNDAGNGVRGMIARIAELGGSLSITGNDGTRVLARLPQAPG